MSKILFDTVFWSFRIFYVDIWLPNYRVNIIDEVGILILWYDGGLIFMKTDSCNAT